MREPTSDPDGQWEQLCQWLASSGAVGFDPDSRTVAPRAFQMPGGETIRGLAALRDLRVGDVLLSIPTYCALIAEELAEPFEDAPWGVRLAAKLVQEQAAGPTSTWWPYLQTLPKEVLTPVEFPDEEVAEVQLPQMVYKIERLRALFARDYEKCPPFALEGCCREDFDRIMTIVYSRTFRLDGRRYLIPAVDCLNHHGTEFQVEWKLDAAAACINLVATTPVAEGEQLYATYGNRGNDDFFLHYGFVPAKNMQDDVELFANWMEVLQWYKRMYLDEASSAAGKDEAACRAAAAAAETEQVKMEAEEAELEAKECGWKGGQRPSETPLRVIRHGQVDGRIMAAFEAFQAEGIAVHPFKAVQDRCEEIISSLGTSAEEDAELMSIGGEMTDGVRLSLRYRLGKKVVLLTVIEMCKSAIEEES